MTCQIRCGHDLTKPYFVAREHIEMLGIVGSTVWLQQVKWLDTHLADGQLLMAWEAIDPTQDNVETQRLVVSTVVLYLHTFKVNWAYRLPAARDAQLIYDMFPIFSDPATIQWAAERRAAVEEFGKKVPDLYPSAEAKERKASEARTLQSQKESWWHVTTPAAT